MCVYVGMCMSVQLPLEAAGIGALGAAVTRRYEHPVWVLGIELMPSARAVCTLSH